MQLSRIQMAVLFVAGLTACAIGTFIAVSPQALYLSYGIDLRGNFDLLSELRAPGTNLAALGGLMLAGLFKPALRLNRGHCQYARFHRLCGREGAGHHTRWSAVDGDSTGTCNRINYCCGMFLCFQVTTKVSPD